MVAVSWFDGRGGTDAYASVSLDAAQSWRISNASLGHAVSGQTAYGPYAIVASGGSPIVFVSGGIAFNQTEVSVSRAR